jgi:hypothetical protein
MLFSKRCYYSPWCFRSPLSVGSLIQDHLRYIAPDRLRILEIVNEVVQRIAEGNREGSFCLELVDTVPDKVVSALGVIGNVASQVGGADP